MSTFRFTSGHECRDNGAGDFDFWCPKGGVLFFLPYLTARTLPAERVCPCCLVKVGEREPEAEPEGPVWMQCGRCWHNYRDGSPHSCGRDT